MTIVVYMVIVVFHSNKDYDQFFEKNNYDQFFEKKERNVDKMMEIARCSILEQKYLKIEQYNGIFSVKV